MPPISAESSCSSIDDLEFSNPATDVRRRDAAAPGRLRLTCPGPLDTENVEHAVLHGTVTALVGQDEAFDGPNSCPLSHCTCEKLGRTRQLIGRKRTNALS